ncbi:MAG: DUF1501 domain-containing protein [Phycisphaerales bacterium]
MPAHDPIADPHLSPGRLESVRALTRRHFFGKLGNGVGLAALASLMGPRAFADGERPGSPAAGPLALRPPHFAPRAKRIVYIHLAGSPPQQDLFDHKPRLNELNGQPCPASLLEKERFAFIKGHPKILGTPYTFKKVGQAGVSVSNLMPHFESIADEVTVIHSMFTDQFNHAPAELFLYTGSARPGRPSMGAWALYGLGSANQNLPGFVVLLSGGKNPSSGKSVWGSGFLPSVYQGCQCRSEGEPVLYSENPPGVTRDARRSTLDALGALNRLRHDLHGDPETLTRIEQYELAFRMQVSVPEVMDLSRESPETLALYGADPARPSFARNCLLARRMLEQGVRYVQLFDHGWDVHGTNAGDDIVNHLPIKCRETDQGAAALVLDLKRRGMLDDTLVVWSGEFGRTAMNEERNGSKFLGRDHHPHCFTIWMAGGGVKRGAIHGATDELGYRITDGPIHIHDLQATILHLMGLDHEKLTYRFSGRDFRLTDVHGRVVRELLA